MIVAARFNGPPTSGNGGYTAGLLGTRGRAIRQLARKEAVRIQVGNRSARLLKSE